MSPFRLELSSAVEISAPREDVWQRFKRVSEWTDWCSVCTSAVVADDFDWKAGQRLALKFRLAGVSVPFNVTISEATAGEHFAWASTKFSVTAVRTFTFEQTSAETTQVTDHKLFTSSVLPLKLFYPRPIIRRMSESMLSDLKAMCEQVGQDA